MHQIQFYNVLIDDMSIIGTRPERRFFIDKVIEKAPQFEHVYTKKPGITSWGQLYFGYAKNVDEMIERLHFDAEYHKSISFFTDMKILLFTLIMISSGKKKLS